MKNVIRSSWFAATVGRLPLVLLALSACDGSSTRPRNITAPIELDGYVTVMELGGPPGGLYTDYCECVSGPVTLLASGRPPETIECQGSYGVPYSDGQRREVTLLGRGWRVTEEYTLPTDPHLSMRIDATCREL
jgi:hypothetical protein